MNDKPPYWLAYLKHPVHTTALLAGVVASIVASIPWGGDALALGLLALAAVETVAIAVVPSLPPFREATDRIERRRRLDALRESLLAEIKGLGGSPYLESFSQMHDRVRSLFSMAADPASTLTRHDVEQLEDATVDYLRLCLSDASMRQRPRKGPDAPQTIQSKLDEVRSQIAEAGQDPEQVQQFRRAEAALVEALGRHSRMAGRRSTMEASLLSIPLRMEEVYQMVMTAPRSGTLGSLLEDSLSKLRITEEVAMDLDAELGVTAFPSTLQRSPSQQQIPVRASTTTRH